MTLKQLEKELTSLYQKASRELTEQWSELLKVRAEKIDELSKAYAKAKASGDKELIKSAGEEYGKYVNNIKQTEWFKGMVNTTAERLSQVNQEALELSNGTIPKVYASNYNEFVTEFNQSDLSVQTGIAFDLVDEGTLEVLITNPEQDLLPTRKLDIPKDRQWNTKAINSQLLQGIYQGESITKIARRMMTVTDMDRASAIRNARTMTTSAECKGRMDSYYQAQAKGIVMRKVWMSAIDQRTRISHLHLDGQEKEIDEPFESDYGEIMYPGDPAAAPQDVYNCRCTIKSNIVGFKRSDGSISYVDYQKTAGDRTIRNDNGKSVRVSNAVAMEKKQQLIDEKTKKNK